MATYEVKEYESLPLIAHKFGFKTYNTLVEANKKKYPLLLPHALVPGMILEIPDKKADEKSQSSGTIAEYLITFDNDEYINIFLHDKFKQIKNPKTDIVLKLGGSQVSILTERSTLDNILISTVNPIKKDILENNSLEIKTTNPLTGKAVAKPIIINLFVRGLSAIIDPTKSNIEKESDNIELKKSIQKLLVNTGYYDHANAVEGDLSKKEFLEALTRFQCEKMNLLEVIKLSKFGFADTNVIVQLASYLGCNWLLSGGIQDILKKEDYNYLKNRNSPLFQSIDALSLNNYTAVGSKWDEINGSSQVEMELPTFTENKFRERHNNWADGNNKIDLTVGENFPIWPQNIFIATSPTPYGDKPYLGNYILEVEPMMVFIDSGRWKGMHRDFSVIYGRHVYLCSYETFFINKESDFENFELHKETYQKKLIKDLETQRDKSALDYLFFKNFKTSTGYIKIKSHTLSTSCNDQDYDWDKINIITPDMHLMSLDKGNVWSKKEGHGFNYKAEIDYFYFIKGLLSENLPSAIGSKLNVVQIGDSYDLWIGYFTQDIRHINKLKLYLNPLDILKGGTNAICFPYYTENENEELKLFKLEYLWEVVKGVHEIQRIYLPIDSKADLAVLEVFLIQESNKNEYLSVLKGTEAFEKQKFKHFELNPAEVAFRLLEKKLGKSRFHYVYGNHDNYLINPAITEAAELWDRKAFFKDGKALFIEHAHRLEKIVPESLNPLDKIKNYDGDISGFVAANNLYLQLSTDYPLDDMAKLLDEKADKFAAEMQQPEYRKEFARYMLGLQSTGGKKPPRIYAIGHTHMPQLCNIKITARKETSSKPKQENTTTADGFDFDALLRGFNPSNFIPK